VAALKADVVCACVGPVTAAPLAELGIPTRQPERQRLGALVKLLVDELS
jgi:uroporphyrinogen-III synthase